MGRIRELRAMGLVEHRQEIRAGVGRGRLGEVRYYVTDKAFVPAGTQE
ncbi:hypothetical protein [Deinococcus cavernae]|nr:hypothetical protein [Deinococcus cavernae]